MDYPTLRRKMVDEQIISRGVTDSRVLAVMARVERHLFVPPAEREHAYDDHPVAMMRGQTVSQPYIVALMTGLLCLEGGERVLEIGTGSGYQTAVLAELAKQVFTVERIPALGEKASRLLGTLGYSNITPASGDGSVGWKEESPFDRILVAASCPRIPFPLEEQLREGGVIVAPVGDMSRQQLVRGVKVDGRLVFEPACDCLFVPLVGEFGMVKDDTGLHGNG
jgi:protein-L-isoaspartate(D-aspartate) O-methyltransferase